MKLRKIMSLTAALAVVMTCIATVFTPVASAETGPEVNTEVAYSESFNSYGNKDYSNTLTALRDYGWYLSNHTQLYTSGSIYSQINNTLADIESNRLKIVSAGNTSGNNVTPLGYGKTFPGVSANEAVTGSWEINFDFVPLLNGGKAQFAFTLNAADGSASGAAAANNIIACSGTTFYLGYHSYTDIASGSVAQYSIPAAEVGGQTWYKVKVYLNCDEKYYSVELYKSRGELIARRSPISLGTDTISFLKFSALGSDKVYSVYIDNVSIEKTERETLIYNEDFESYSSVTLAKSGVTTGGATEDVSGNSYFEGYTPWRAYNYKGSTICKAYEWGTDASEGNAVRLTGSPGSGLVYMPVKEDLVTASTQPVRGFLKVSFKVMPNSVKGTGLNAFNVFVAPTYGSDFTSLSAFTIAKSNNITAIMKNSGTQTISASKWYNVDLVFDVVNSKVVTTVTDIAASQKFTFEKTISDLNAVKGIMFESLGGDVSVDDINIGYTPKMKVTSVTVNDIAATSASDFFTHTGTTYDIDSSTNISVEYSNPTDASISGFVAIVYFGADGRFLYARHATKTVEPGELGTISFKPKTIGLEEEPQKVAIYLWDSLTNANPYYDPIVFE